ncbi:MAG: hypothetical protein BWX70_00055 [Verrucomicrobia bacterium ADurb.Bin070]|nr:MAG: hypothetical protein BWX70_00055 [Verrucomicrobia bacterium ADurb.Bin070]
MVLETGARCGIVHIARHDVERHGFAVQADESDDFARVKIKERHTRDRTDPVRALWPVVPQPRALAARHQQHRHAPLAQLRFALGKSLAIGAPAPLHDGRRTRRHGGRHVPAGQHTLHAGDFTEINLVDLSQQRVAFRSAKYVPKTQHMRLSGFRQLFFCLFNCHAHITFPSCRQCAFKAFCLRYASMNGWMRPSITPCTFDVCSSVRWSFTIV